MAHSYTPGLRVTNKTIIKKDRILPLKGDVIKKVGDEVTRDEIVARTDLPGNVRTINIVNLLGIQPNEINDFMKFKVGDSFKKGDVIAESKSFIKWFNTTIQAPISGTIESISAVTGQVLLREPPIPVEVKGYLNGKVIEVVPKEGVIVETVASFIQGIMGIGGETWGTLKFAVNSPEEVLDTSKITDEFKDSIIVGGSFASHEAIKKAISVGAKGLIVGGIRDGDLRKILGYDLGVAITGSETIGISLVLTEGFGQVAIAERTYNCLKEREGEIASISGATQIRAGVIRPEIIIPYSKDTVGDMPSEEYEARPIEIGNSIRVIRPPYFGKIGKVHSLPSELTQIESETKARVLTVEFPDGNVATIPRANVEQLEK
jgi:biotin carboxyl carrier protein